MPVNMLLQRSPLLRALHLRVHCMGDVYPQFDYVPTIEELSITIAGGPWNPTRDVSLALNQRLSVLIVCGEHRTVADLVKWATKPAPASLKLIRIWNRSG